MSKIKEWVKNNPKNALKILIIFAVVLYYLFYFFSKSVSAAELNLTVNLPPYPDGLNKYDKYVVFYGSDAGTYFCVGFNDYSEGYNNIVAKNYDGTYFDMCGFGQCAYYYLNEDTAEWTFDLEFSDKKDFNGKSLFGVITPIYSNIDIYDENGKVFFHKTPMSGKATLLRRAITPQKITEMTLMGIGGILAVVAVSVIGFQAFRKGWKFLKTTLHRA